MGIFGDILGGLFGGSAGGGKSNQADWDQIMQLMELSADLNRYDSQGLFTNVGWEEDPQSGKWTQSTSINPGMQGGFDMLMNRANTEPERYTSPGQFSQMLDAKMANQMQRHGILNEDQNRQPTDFGPVAASRPGGNPNAPGAYTPPPPPQQAQPQAQPQPQTPPGVSAEQWDMIQRMGGGMNRRNWP